MPTPTVTAAALALMLTTVPATCQDLPTDSSPPEVPVTAVVPESTAEQDAVQETVREADTVEETPVAAPDPDVSSDATQEASPGEQEPEPTVTPDAEPTQENPGEDAETSSVERAVVTDGYHEDGYDRPFWWASDGLHFRDPIPASGYVNINVPGANNVNIDLHRELIGTTFIPWSYFGLQPGMCITWTESNGYNYHFGEDNSGRGGVDERDWTYCVPGETEPEEPVEPEAPVAPATPDRVDPAVVTSSTQGTTHEVASAESYDTADSATNSDNATSVDAETNSASQPLAMTGFGAATLATVAAAAAAAGAGLLGVARRRTR